MKTSARRGFLDHTYSLKNLFLILQGLDGLQGKHKATQGMFVSGHVLCSVISRTTNKVLLKRRI